MKFDVAQIKKALKRKGWNYRQAALAIGKSYQWVSDVLNGHETSRPVLIALSQLPENPNRRVKATK